MSSRLRFVKVDPDKPSNSSKGNGLILETPYKPGFVEDKDLETVKMAIDKELSEISNAFYKTTEKTADTITRIDKIEIEGDNLLAKIEEVDRVSKEGDAALAERITTLTATVDDNSAKITEETRVRTDADSALAERITKLEADTGDDWKAAIEEEKIARVDGDGALASQITTLKAQSEAGDATLTQNMTVIADKTGKLEAKWGVQTNVNGKVSGIQLNNDGASSSFSVVADRFTISDGTSNTIPPFEVVGGNTRIKSAFVEVIQSDNWNGSTTGWAINKAGYANFQGVTVRGNIIADSGTFNGTVNASAGTFTGTVNANGGEFNNVVIKENCVVLGTLYADRIIGLPTGKSFGPLNADLNGGDGGWATIATFNLDSADGRFNIGGLAAINSNSSGYSDGFADYFPCYRVLLNGAQVAFFYTGLPRYNLDSFYPTSASSGKVNGGSTGSSVTIQIGAVSVTRSTGAVTLMTNHRIQPYAKVQGLTIFFYNSIDK